MNINFYNTAFSSNDKQLIKKNTLVDNGQSSCNLPYENYYVCDNTIDKVFLLSKADVCNPLYGFQESELSDEYRQVNATDYAYSQGIHNYF